jgi:hypothetical protein
MARAGTLINGALTLAGVLAQGETATAPDAQESLRRLNQMVSSWRTQFGTIPAVVRTVFPLVANQQTYTIGLGGEFNVPRPLTIPAAALWLNALGTPETVTITRSGFTATVTLVGHGYAVGDETNISGAIQLDYNGLQTVQSVPTANTFTFTVQGTPVTPATGTITASPVNGQPVEIPRPVITDQAYWGNQLKNMPNSEFTGVYYNPTYPFGTIVLWPRPNTAENQLVLYLQTAFTGFADLVTEYDFPDLPGYADALEYNLAVRLCAPFGRSLSNIPEIVELAREHLGLIKRANNRLVDLQTDATVLTYDRRHGYNLNTGTGQ